MNPYMAFSMEERKRIVAADPSRKADIGGVAKEIGKKWKAMSEAEKAKYAKKGASMKVTRKAKKSKKAAAAEEGTGRKEKKTRKARKMSGYMKFASQERKRIVAENPSMRKNITAVAKEMGKRWRAMSDAEKKKYE
jgi:hypothetical protein